MWTYGVTFHITPRAGLGLGAASAVVRRTRARPPAPARAPNVPYSETIKISTRLFWKRPSGVELSAIGLDFP